MSRVMKMVWAFLTLMLVTFSASAAPAVPADIVDAIAVVALIAAAIAAALVTIKLTFIGIRYLGKLGRG